MRENRRQYLKSRLNELADERRRMTSVMPKGKSLLDQENIEVTPVIEYAWSCVCGASGTARSVPTTCSRYPTFCKNPRISFKQVTGPVRS